MSREPAFKRATKATLSIHKDDLGAGLRALLTKRVQPMVTFPVAEMAELAARRFEQELERMCEGLEVAVSAFVSEVANDGAGKREPKAVILSQARPDLPTYKFGLNGPEIDNDVRGEGSNPPPGCAVPEPAVAAEQSSTSQRSDFMVGQRAYKQGLPFGSLVAVGGAVNPPELVNLEPSPNFRIGSLTQVPAPARTSRKGRTTCSKCGTAGHNARSCRRKTFDEQDAAQQDANLDTREARRAHIIARADAAKPLSRNADRPVAHRDDDKDDNPNADERWSKDEIDKERASYEGNKLRGKLPTIRSSWGF